MPQPSPPAPAPVPRVPTARPRLGALLAVLPAGLALLGGSGCAPPAARAPALQAIARWEDRRSADADSLARCLGARDAHVRLAAARAAGRIGREDAIGGLVGLLGDRSPALRAEAATALGFIGSAQAIPPLARLLATRDRGLRLAAIEALGRLPQGGLPLLGPARRANMREAGAAWDGLRERAGELAPDTLRAALADGLARDERTVLWRVLRCAEKARPDSALTVLIARHARARDPQVRVHAFRALGAQGTPGALKALLEGGEAPPALPGVARARVRVAQLRALGRCGHALLAGSPAGPAESAYGRLAAQLADGSRDRDPAVVRTAYEAMTALVEGQELPPEAAGRESLVPAWRLRLASAAQARLGDPDPPLRAAALTALGALRGAAVQDLLAAVARGGAEGPAQVAAAACRGLGLGGDAGAIGALGAAAARGHPLAREAALEAVGTLWTRLAASLSPGAAQALRQAALAILLPAAADADFAVAATAAEQLGQVPGPESVTGICRLLERARRAREGAGEVRLGAYAGLAAAGRAGALRPAAGGSGAPQPTVAGAVALPDSLRPRVVATLTRGFDDPDVRVRLQARAAAEASGLLPAALVPSEASLRATAPALPRDPRQAALTEPFKAPRLRGVTARGEFVIALDGRAAPNTAATLVRLVRAGFYRDLQFHRVVPDFVVQGGDPRGDGWGGPGWSLRAERSRIPYERGTVGIADSGLDTGGSQFFVCLSPQPHLNGRYTVAGRVVRGMNVLDAVEQGETFSLEVLP